MSAATDDLTKPLGVENAPGRRRLRVPVVPILTGLILAGLGGAGLYVAVVDDPLGGEPHAEVPVTFREADPAREAQPGGAIARIQELPNDRGRTTAVDSEASSGVAVVRPDGTSAPASVFIRVPDAPQQGGSAASPAASPPATPEAGLIERTRFGALPRIGTDGAKPWQIYARATGTLPGSATPAARVAIIVGGLGISSSVTQEAISRLPEAVSLAFAPYGSDLDRLAARAREDGHEILLQVPMEPFDYPDNDPGPHTLTVRAKAEDNLERLRWVMGRITGYAGIVNFMGARLTADENALGPIVKEIGGRGLGVVDDGSSSRSRLAEAARGSASPSTRADLVLDAVPRQAAIDQELARLEELARKKGFAIGTASALPLTVDRIARWAREAEARGILLVPVSAAWRGEVGG